MATTDKAEAFSQYCITRVIVCSVASENGQGAAVVRNIYHSRSWRSVDILLRVRD